MHPSLFATDHRPWPLPSGPWKWRQSWCDLLFAHWPVPAAALRGVVPRELAIQELDGSAWIAVVPFRMEGVMRRRFPDLPGISAFPELNVRTYVEHRGKPGVWFLSLDAANALAVWAGRRLFHLPYHRARMRLTASGDGVLYESVRRSAPEAAVFRASYTPTSAPYRAAPGSLLHRLTERYCLYARTRSGRLYRTEVHHPPWPLQDARTEIDRNGMLGLHGIEVEENPALVHFARRVDVVAWSPTLV